MRLNCKYFSVSAILCINSNGLLSHENVLVSVVPLGVLYSTENVSPAIAVSINAVVSVSSIFEDKFILVLFLKKHLCCFPSAVVKALALSYTASSDTSYLKNLCKMLKLRKVIYTWL